ncbi:MAG: SRPBCC family protein [Ardenticatenaceae bacterium]
MKELYTEIEINASAERVWQLLTDFSRFPEWNPFMPRAKGQIAPNEKLEVYLTPPNNFGMTIKPTVTKVEPNRELRWLGHLITPGIFDGEHIFTIERLSSDHVRLIHREEFKGGLVPLMLALVGNNTKRGFEAMNQALKTQAEL